jgi:hypothetical protein
MRDASAVGSLGIDIRRRRNKGILRYRPAKETDRSHASGHSHGSPAYHLLPCAQGQANGSVDICLPRYA